MPNEHKSIDVLCQEQIDFVRTVQLTDRKLDEDILRAVCGGSVPKLVTKLQGEDFMDHFFEMLINEEAYDLIELRQLDYNSRFLVRTDTKYIEERQKLVSIDHLDLKRPPVDCRHYNNCKVYVFGPDCKLETIADMRFGEIKLPVEWARAFCNRLKRHRATLKMSPGRPLLVHGFNAIATIAGISSGISTGEDIRNLNCHLVYEMFQTYENFSPVDGVVKDLDVPFKGDFFREDGIKNALAAKVRLGSVRPYIMCTSAWSNEIDWLECLIRNINYLSIKEVGVLCPDSSTANQIKKRPNHNLLSARVNTLDEWPSATFDYVIIYKAHSIGPAEAIRALLTVKQEGCVVLIGDPKMPNLRARCQLVRDTCGSVLQWFYNKERYPEYFRQGKVCMCYSPLCFDYSPKIFSIFKEIVRYSPLVNITDGDSVSKFDEDTALMFYPSSGVARMSGCSPYNLDEACMCLELVREQIENGLSGRRIGVVTTYCAQKMKIASLIRAESQCANVKVGLLEDFENSTRDCIIISTVETAERTLGGKRYPFDDLIYDVSCFHLAMTRAKCKIILVGDLGVLGKIDHWARLINESVTIKKSTVAEQQGEKDNSTHYLETTFLIVVWIIRTMLTVLGIFGRLVLPRKNRR